MKALKSTAFAATLVLFGCGMSDDEIETKVGMACAEIEATRVFEAAKRVKVANELRVELGLNPPLRTDVIDSFTATGRCAEMVFLSQADLDEIERLEQERQAKEAQEKMAQRQQLEAEAKVLCEKLYNTVSSPEIYALNEQCRGIYP